MGIKDPPLILQDGRHRSDETCFDSIPYVRLYERIEKGLSVRKRYYKYLLGIATLEKEYGQYLQSDGNIDIVHSNVIHECFYPFVQHMKEYNVKMGQLRKNAGIRIEQQASCFYGFKKVQKWNASVQSQVHKAVYHVQQMEKKMTKSILRREKAKSDLEKWSSSFVDGADKGTGLEVQKNKQIRMQKMKICQEEVESSDREYTMCQGWLLQSIQQRDSTVQQATVLCKLVEEDRVDAMLIGCQQVVQIKKEIAEAENKFMLSMENVLETLHRDQIIEKYTLEAKVPDLTHREAKALQLLTWHEDWHDKYLIRSNNDIVDEQVKEKDIAIMKDFIKNCFIGDEYAGKISAKHRHRFVSANAVSLYERPLVRKIVLDTLNEQRSREKTLSKQGFYDLGTALNFIVNVCANDKDIACMKTIVNMVQTFYRYNPEQKKEYLIETILQHQVWFTPEFWGDALLESIGEELSKSPLEQPWQHLDSTSRVQKVLWCHNVVFGQLATYIYNMAAFGLSRRQIQQFTLHVSISFELSEEQQTMLNESMLALEIKPMSCTSTASSTNFTASVFPATLDIVESPSTIKSIASSLNPFRRYKNIFESSSAPSPTNIPTGDNHHKMYSTSSPEPIKNTRHAPQPVRQSLSAKSLSGSDSWADLFATSKNINNVVRYLIVFILVAEKTPPRSTNRIRAPSRSSSPGHRPSTSSTKRRGSAGDKKRHTSSSMRKSISKPVAAVAANTVESKDATDIAAEIAAAKRKALNQKRMARAEPSSRRMSERDRMRRDREAIEAKAWEIEMLAAKSAKK